MSSNVKFIINAGIIVGGVSAVYGFWYLFSEGGQARQKEIVKKLPEGNVIRMEESKLRTALTMQVIKKAAESNENISRKPPWGS
ncbi:ubiquinol-cytochrome-c reductase complex assembly factor 3-like [Protopterus annectens]|uniref:ubiquinol-cytochrome-c reductase complex assembly factor 3-like n=1 Tax=Protopterus annectens TaxID=7888 RepID=UPI001CFC004C|nr:ubiquinol-cytochrome-c reductase complex assembly factor 3-like [Protopterus annectens]